MTAYGYNAGKIFVYNFYGYFVPELVLWWGVLFRPRLFARESRRRDRRRPRLWLQNLRRLQLGGRGPGHDVKRPGGYNAWKIVVLMGIPCNYVDEYRSAWVRCSFPSLPEGREQQQHQQQQLRTTATTTLTTSQHPRHE